MQEKPLGSRPNNWIGRVTVNSHIIGKGGGGNIIFEDASQASKCQYDLVNVIYKSAVLYLTYYYTKPFYSYREYIKTASEDFGKDAIFFLYFTLSSVLIVFW